MDLQRLLEIVISLGYTQFEADAEKNTIGIGYSPEGEERHNFMVWVCILNPTTILLRANSVAYAEPDAIKFREMCLYLNQFQAESPIKWFMGEQGHVMAELLLFFATRKMLEQMLNLILGEFATKIGEVVDTFDLVVTES